MHSHTSSKFKLDNLEAAAAAGEEPVEKLKKKNMNFLNVHQVCQVVTRERLVDDDEEEEEEKSVCGRISLAPPPPPPRFKAFVWTTAWAVCLALRKTSRRVPACDAQ